MAVINVRGHEVLLDDEDLHLIKGNISLSNHGKYAMIWNGSKQVYLHRYIMNCPAGKQVDHINGNALDNRRCNMRLCSQSENLRNVGARKTSTSGLKGVETHKLRSGRTAWSARIAVDKKRFYLGFYNTPEEAHAAYCEAAKKYHGEFARTE